MEKPRLLFVMWILVKDFDLIGKVQNIDHYYQIQDGKTPPFICYVNTGQQFF